MPCVPPRRKCAAAMRSRSSVRKNRRRLIAARSGCPLVVGRTKQASYVASDVMAMLAHTRDVIYLEEGDVAVVTQHDVQVTDADGREVSRKTTKDHLGCLSGGKERLSTFHAEGDPRAAADDSRYHARPLLLRDW